MLVMQADNTILDAELKSLKHKTQTKELWLTVFLCLGGLMMVTIGMWIFGENTVPDEVIIASLCITIIGTIMFLFGAHNFFQNIYLN